MIIRELFVLFAILINDSNGHMKVSIDQFKGDYNISINNHLWLRSSSITIYTNNRWYTLKDQSLRLIERRFSQGIHFIFGQWNETELIYQFNINERATNISGTIRQWANQPAITFSFHSGWIELNNDQLLDMDQVRTTFPSFHIEQINEQDQRAYFTFAGMMGGDLEKHAGIWNSQTRFGKTGMSGGPIILFNSSENGQGDALILSPYSEFMSTSISIDNQILEYGYLGSIKSIPSNSSNSFLVFYSSKGINQLMKEWGEFLQKSYSRRNEYRLNDLTINYLGYYTDNGGYYYYHTESEMNYEETIVQIKENVSLPIHYIQLDSWWYYKGVGDGVQQWISRPQIFPSGLQGLNNKLNSFPLVAHNRYWSSDTIYSSQYHFLIDQWNLKSLPMGDDSFWIDFFSNSTKDFHLILYEQDWMNHQTIDFRPLREDIHLGKQWLISMGNAADQLNINIQYCMSLPRHVLQALQINRVTQARVSDDYYIHLLHQIDQWKIGISAMLANALGLAPFKDIFWSNQFEPGAPYQSNAKEILPDREILIATLSTGPVALADGLSFIDRERIMRCCREDGLILKPSQPLTMIDLLISDWAINHGISQGELYSTHTNINNQIFSFIFASAMKRNYSIIPTMIGGSSSGLIWSFDNPYQISLFDQNHRLQISRDLCDEKSFCLWYNSPLWSLNDSLSTNYSLMGEMNKWTFVSVQRFSSLYWNNDQTNMTIVLQGLPNETINLLIYHSHFQSILQIVCSFSSDNSPLLLKINSTSAFCI